MTKEPRIIFSLDAYPLMNNRWQMGNRLKDTIYMTALSVLYAHLWYKDIELYVDEIAYKYLYMLPCRVTKMSITSEKDIWMKAKMHAIEQQTTPFVHLDNDVFIKNKIDFNFNKVLLERQEEGYRVHYKKQLEFFNTYTQNYRHWHKDLGTSFSCGILGFRDMNLRNQFLFAYNEVESAYKIHRAQYAPYRKMGFEPCIVIEQYNLACLLHFLKVEPEVLLKGKDLKDHSEYAKKIGYSHLFGVKKYQEKITKEIENRLYRIFPYWYGEVRKSLEKSGIVDHDSNSTRVA